MRRNLNTKEGRDAQRQSYFEYTKAQVTEYTAEACTVGLWETNGRFGLLIFDGSAGKPSEYTTYRTAAQRDDVLTRHLEACRRSAAWKAEQRAKNHGKVSDAAATAAALRPRLAREFPGVKFSVTSETFSGGDAVRIHWQDGPVQDLVEHIADQYQAGHFDGMEDIYLNRDIDPALSCPGAKYVSCSRVQSIARRAELEADCIARYGCIPEQFMDWGKFNSWKYENYTPQSWPAMYQSMQVAQASATAAAMEAHRLEERAEEMAKQDAEKFEQRRQDAAPVSVTEAVTTFFEELAKAITPEPVRKAGVVVSLDAYRAQRAARV